MAKKTVDNELAKRLSISKSKSGSIKKTDKISKPDAKKLSKNPLFNALYAKKQQQQQLKNSNKKLRITENDDFKIKSVISKDEISFKDVSKPKFLRLYNLQNGTDLADIELVVSKICPVKKILMKNMPGNNLIMCEIFYNSKKKIDEDKVLQQGLKMFDGKKLDGNVLKCQIDSVSKILKKKQYDAFLKELKDPNNKNISFNLKIK